MKRRLILIILLMACLCLSRTVFADNTREIIQDGVGSAMQGLDISAWEQVLQSLPQEVQSLWDGKSVRYVLEQTALGENTIFSQLSLGKIGSVFGSAFSDGLSLLLKLLAVAMLTGLVRALSDAGIKGLNDITGFVCHCFGALIAMAAFASLAVLGRDCIGQISRFIELSFPVLLTLLTSVGGIASAGVFQPAMGLLCGGVSVVLQNVVLPIILAGGVMGMLNNMTGRVQLGNFFQLSKSSAKWVIGLTFTFYFAITSLQGMTAASFDGISVRTAKYALDKFVPIVGGIVSGTVDTVLGCAVLVKNAAGMATVMLALSIVLAPLMRIAVSIFAFRIAAALCEPVSEPRLPKMFSSLADILTYLFAAVAALASMFMITVGLLMSAGNANLMAG